MYSGKVSGIAHGLDEHEENVEIYYDSKHLGLSDLMVWWVLKTGNAEGVAVLSLGWPGIQTF